MSTIPMPRRRMGLEMLFFAGWLGVLLVAIHLTPSPSLHGTHTELGLPPCGFYVVFGRPCPTCGLTTSFAAMAHLKFAMAARAHPMGPPLFLTLAIGGFACGYTVLIGRRIVVGSIWVQHVFVAIMVLTLVVGAIRIFLWRP